MCTLEGVQMCVYRCTQLYLDIVSSNRTIRGVSILFPISFTGEQTFTPGHAHIRTKPCPRLAVLAMPDQA